MNNRKMLTYGEAWFKAKASLYDNNIPFHDALVFNDLNHKKRMSKDESNRYYTNKINKEFERLGYAMKKKVDSISDFSTRFPIQLKIVKRETRKMLKNEIRANRVYFKEMVG